MISAYLQPSWDAILTGPTSHRRRVSRGWTAGGVILMVVGALLLSTPLLAMLAITYDPGRPKPPADFHRFLPPVAFYGRGLIPMVWPSSHASRSDSL